MASLHEFYIKLETLETIIATLKKKNEKGVSITVSCNDEIKEFTRQDGTVVYQNVSAYVSQNAEQRKAKAAKYYVGNGKSVWGEGGTVVPGKTQQTSTPVENATIVPDDQQLPF